jgi:cell division protein FtsQ
MARETKKSGGGIRWRLWFAVAGIAVGCVSTAMAAYKVHDYAWNDPQFVLSRETKDGFAIEGLNHASRARVMRIFAGDFGRSIFTVPLAERRRRLLAIDWIEDASVSRLWPDRLVVRVRERRPVAFVYFPNSVLLIDSQGVLLTPPVQAQFSFPVLSGVRVDETEEQRREQVRCLLRVLGELGASAKEISEVNAADCENIRIITRMDNRAVELIMGDSNFARRYRNFVSHYREMRRRSPGVKVFDLRLADRIAAEE